MRTPPIGIGGDIPLVETTCRHRGPRGIPFRDNVRQTALETTPLCASRQFDTDANDVAETATPLRPEPGTEAGTVSTPPRVAATASARLVLEGGRIDAGVVSRRRP